MHEKPPHQSTSPEVQEIVDFLADIQPFDVLDRPLLIETARRITTTYHRAQSPEQIIDYENPSLFIVRAGVFDVRDDKGELVDRVTREGFFGFLSLLTGESRGHTLHVTEDGLLYRLDQNAFKSLRNRSDKFDHFFVQAFERRLRVGLRSRAENTAWAMRISEIMSGKLHAVGESTSIAEAARTMTRNNIASLAILDDTGDLIGIFTDKDCRARVIAEGVSSDSAIAQVMTPDPISIEKSAMVHQATLAMIRNKNKTPAGHRSG